MIEIVKNIKDKDDYLAMVKVVAAGADNMTPEDGAKLADIYVKNMRDYKVGAATLAKVSIIMRTLNGFGAEQVGRSGLISMLDQADAEALQKIVRMVEAEHTRNADAAAAMDALPGDCAEELKLAAARAALDILSSCNDIGRYQNEVESLVNILQGCNSDIFEVAGAILREVRGARIRCRW